jgi:hypothetical protein
LFVLCVHIATAQSTRQLETIHAFEQARYKAILGNDLNTLETLLAPELIYTHSNATQEDKTAYLDALRNGKYQFRRFETDSSVYRMISKNMVVATGLARLAGQVNGKPFEITARFTAVYVCRKKHWMLHTWQTTRLR